MTKTATKPFDVNFYFKQLTKQKKLDYAIEVVEANKLTIYECENKPKIGYGEWEDVMLSVAIQNAVCHILMNLEGELDDFILNGNTAKQTFDVNYHFLKRIAENAVLWTLMGRYTEEPVCYTCIDGSDYNACVKKVKKELLLLFGKQ